MSDIGFASLDELKREAYATPTTEDLVRAGTHGAGLKQLLAMNAAGYTGSATWRASSTPATTASRRPTSPR